MSERDIRGLMAALPAPSDEQEGVLYKFIEMALIDLNRVAEANEMIAKTLSFLADRIGKGT